MPTIAATATAHPTMIWLLLIGAGLLATGWYVAHCAWFPFAGCRRCDGAGRRRSSSGRSWRDCPRCKGSGRRVRLGRQVWQHIRQTRDDQ